VFSYGDLALGESFTTENIYDSPALDILLNLRLPGESVGNLRDLMTISIPSKSPGNAKVLIYDLVSEKVIYEIPYTAQDDKADRIYGRIVRIDRLKGQGLGLYDSGFQVTVQDVPNTQSPKDIIIRQYEFWNNQYKN
jgi:hypothetical protein